MKKGTAAVTLVAFAAILALAVWYMITILISTGAGVDRNLKLGLDLAGGVSITYQAVGDTPTAEEMSDTIRKLEQRIENDLGAESQTTEASVYQVGDDRITVEIPGVTDANALLEELGTPGNLYFIAQTDSEGNTNYSYNGAGYTLNYDLDTLKENGSIVLSGSDVASAEAGYQTNQTTQASEPVVSITLSDAGTEAFAAATEKAYAAGESIGIYYDGEFISVPSVNAVIADGRCIIEGMESYDAASSLASYIRIGGLDIELEEIQSEIVGAQLGSDALRSSLIAGGIGLIIVMVFLVAVYWLPGFVAALALALYTALMIAVLYWFDLTLTLPGIAGIILSIGMAVDANVIIFARIREELGAGKIVREAATEGFAKAMSAIVDGNVTTLIAAAVLGVLGSGTVKGFAVTLAIGVVLSMFTALVISRLLMNVFISLGLDSPKLYGRAARKGSIDFLGKKAVFFAISLAIIAAGFISMGVHGARGDKSLNYSLEFLGGTSTTVTFNEEYSLEEIDEKIVPVFTSITGDNDIQTQKVDNGNTVIIKTRTLGLEEREALDAALEEGFGVDSTAISSENISSMISGEMRRQSLVAVMVAAICMLIYIWIRFKDIRFASSAIIALIHDVLVVLAIYAIARISVGSAFIACMLTVIGYSVNDTIVIFDRIRDNLSSLRKENEENLAEVANRSLNETLSRSISTSITTAITVLMLLILGVSTIKEFALPLLCGVICGTYSSICLATELWYLMRVHIRPKNGGEAKNGSYLSEQKKKAVKANKENQGIIV